MAIEIRLLLSAILLLACSSFVNAQTSPNAVIEYWTFDPLVVPEHGNKPVTLTVQTSGNPGFVKFKFAHLPEQELKDEGNGRFSLTFSSGENRHPNSPAYAHRAFMGLLNIGQSDPFAYKLVLGVDDGSIPDVAVLDLDEHTRISPRIVNFHIPRENPAELDLHEVTRLFYQFFPDEFDFINIVTTPARFQDSHFIHVKNTTQGLGLAQFDASSQYGSAGRLKGVVRIPTPEHFDLAGREYLRMLGFNWMNYSKNLKLEGAWPNWPLSDLTSGIMGYQPHGSREYQHFDFYISKEITGFFPFFFWTGDYILRHSESTPLYNSMELYLMGLMPAYEVPEYTVFENQNQQICHRCKLLGPAVPYTVGDLRNSHGTRAPAYPDAQSEFKVATIVVSDERLLSAREIRHFDWMASRGEGSGELTYRYDNIIRQSYPFRAATGKRGRLDARITKELSYEINPGLNDAWYNQDMPGQGFFLEVLPNTRRLLLGWFAWEQKTYHSKIAELGDPDHRWMTAQGNYSGDRADLVLYRTVGGQLNSSTAVENKEIGKLVFRLHSCNHAVLEYEIDSIYSSGQVPIRRIASDNASWCEELQTDHVQAVPLIESDSFQITEGLNGAWFNPEWPGQGIFLNVLPDSRQFFLGWFTWDVERLFSAGNDWNIGDMNQRWLTAQGYYEGNTADLDLSLTRGGVLLSVEPRPVTEPYGKAQIRFSDCETAELEYDIPSLGMNGLIPLKRNSSENVEACREMAKRPPPPSWRVNTITRIEQEHRTGGFYSIAIGADGRPIVSFPDFTDNSLKLLRCNDSRCAGNNELISTVDDQGDWAGGWSSLTVGADGLPVMAYTTRTADLTSLMVAKCNDAACSGQDETVSSVDPQTFHTGFWASLAVGNDGFPVISHSADQDGIGHLRVTKCNDDACAGGDEISTRITENLGGGYTSLAIGQDGLPVISAHDYNARLLYVIKCNDAACAGQDETITMVAQDILSTEHSLAIGSDGLPIIAYQSNNPSGLKVIKCNDPACAGGDELVSLVDGDGELPGSYPDIAIRADGNPIIAYEESVGALRQLVVASCNDPACSGGDETITVVDGPAGVGQWLSMTLGRDGYPITAYHDALSKPRSLKVAHCGTADCVEMGSE